MTRRSRFVLSSERGERLILPAFVSTPFHSIPQYPHWRLVKSLSQQLDELLVRPDLGRSFRPPFGSPPLSMPMPMPLDELASALQCSLFPVQVLIVDDDSDARGAIRRVLERQGYSVIVAGTGAEALKLLEGTHVPVDLLITDVEMPGLLGDALVVQVRRSWPELPVLFISGDPGYATLPQTAGGRAQFLLKPFTQDGLHLAVLRLLAPSTEAAEDSPTADNTPAPGVSRTPVLL